MTDPPGEPLRRQVTGAAMVLTIDRPAARNAINHALRADLERALADADAADAIAAVVLTATDPVFSAGLDLREAAPPAAARTSPGEVLRATRTPLIAAVNGPCYTGALELVLSCDIVVASERATFSDTHAQFGFLPGWGMSALLAQAVGVRKAKEMSITGAALPARKAAALGLVNHLVPHGRLLAVALELCDDIAAADRGAVEATLALYDDSDGRPRNERLALERERFLGWKADLEGMPARRAAIALRRQRKAARW